MKNRSRRKKIFFPLLLVSTLFFYSCKSEAELAFDITMQEAEKRLKKGDVTFILEAEPEKMREIAYIHPSAPFYAGLLMKAEEAAPKLRTINLFTAALSSPSTQVQEAASHELLTFMLDDPGLAASLLEATGGAAPPPLKAAVLYFTGDMIGARNAASGERLWDRAFYLLSTLKLEGDVSQELFQFLLDGTVADVHTWTYSEASEWEGAASVFNETERWAIEGHFETARRSYGGALRTFRKVIAQNHTLFFKNPALIADLGRCFQYAGAGVEGVELFIAWDNTMQEWVRTKKEWEKTAHARYNLLFFAGRMERQASHWSEASDYFTRSLVFAPDAEQEDACIWYILDVAFKQSPEKAIPLLRIYANQWNDASYFSDVLGELCQAVVASHSWTRLLEIFSCIRSVNGAQYADGAIIAQYAYIIGRIISEGYMPAAKAAAYTGLDGSAGSFFRLAYEEQTASFYYRTLSASHLGKHVFTEQPEKLKAAEKKKKTKKNDEAEAEQAGILDFLLGFFNYGASRYAFPYIQRSALALTIDESRILAQILADDGQYYESIRLAGSYMKTKGYSFMFSDMFLYYPRPFYAIIEKYAEQTNISEATLFGLIHTESAFKASAVSSAGAEGLAQIMDFTGVEMAERIRREGGPDYLKSGLNLKDPEVNVHIGSYYLAHLIGRTDAVLLALLGYNGGPTRVRRLRVAEPLLPDDLFLETISITETREYGKRVAAAAAAYGYMYYNVKMEDISADILKKRRL
ncbi:MAG: lytic transglycosylase domain-containing protein [Treponema sp.]|jgi:soluble lytic murein transglycosylase|nr:lytic transglycosylase domain-containing protein [Treponema sp.]